MIKYNLTFFGGRGSASSIGGGGGATFKNEFRFPDGTVAQYDGDLNFGAKDPNLSPAVRQRVEAWEAKRVNNKIEYAYSVDEDGNPLGEARGGKTSVTSPHYFHDTEGATFTHNHPREEGSGYLGGTFSQADMENFAKFGNTTERAAAKEGTYSVSKGANFNQSGFLSYVTQASNNFQREASSAENRLRTQVAMRMMTWEQYNIESTRAFNTALVNLHNAYSAGQSRYGYTYTLEQR